MDVRAPLYVTLEGYAVEGGFDRAYEPATCFLPMIALGHVEGPGDADGLWSQYESAIDALSSTGITGIRLSVEWARVEPRRGRVDESALDRYGEVGAYARSRGLAVTVALVDRAWPSWLGQEAWLLPWVAPHVLDHARRVVQRLSPSIDAVVVFADRDVLIRGGYLEGIAPPWRTGATVDAGFCERQIDDIISSLGGDPLVGPLLVTEFASVSLDTPCAEIERMRRRFGLAQVHARSALAGHGPCASRQGLLKRDGEAWCVDASEELLEALR